MRATSPIWVGGQLMMSTLPFIAVWIAGLAFLWRSRRPLWRGLAWAYGLLFVFFAVTTGAQIYYLAGAYVYLIAAGAIPLEQWLAGSRRRPVVAASLAAVATAAAVPLVLPVLPARDIGWIYGVNQAPAESVGWPELVQHVRTAWSAIPACTAALCRRLHADYGEAGAVNELGRRSGGLPVAVSGANNEWWWGPGNRDATTVLVVAPGPRDVTGYGTVLRRMFKRVEVVATLRNSAGLDNEEWGGHIYRCTYPVRPWGELWSQLRHYD